MIYVLSLLLRKQAAVCEETCGGFTCLGPKAFGCSQPGSQPVNRQVMILGVSYPNWAQKRLKPSWTIAWMEPHERPWARDTHQSHPNIPSLQNLS